MTTFVKTSALALAMMQHTSSVNAITLKTLMENQLAADVELENELSIQARLEESAIMNVARDIKELSFAQVSEDQEPSTDNFEGIASQLLELSKNQDLNTLKECIYDVKNNIYQTSDEAKAATGSLPEGQQAGTILVRNTQLLADGEVLTGQDGNVVPVTAAAETNATDQALPAVPVVVEAEPATEAQQVVVVESVDVQAEPVKDVVEVEAGSTEEISEPAAEEAVPDDSAAANTSEEVVNVDATPAEEENSDDAAKTQDGEATTEQPANDAPEDGDGFLGVW